MKPCYLHLEKRRVCFLIIFFVQCENARTYRECREQGYVETCTKKQNSCFVETLKEKVPRVSFPDYDYHKGRKGDVVRVEINMGCKQPEACYANKKQNFLVRSGRQCFPKVIFKLEQLNYFECEKKILIYFVIT